LLAALARPGVVADLGCGDGAVLRSLHARGLLGPTTYAVDLSPERVAVAVGVAPGVVPIVADATSVEALAASSLDGVIASQVIEHVPDDRALVAEIVRLLKPAGWWYIGTVLRKPRAWWFYRVDGAWRLDPTHVREYESEAALLAVLNHEQLEVEQVSVEPLRYPVSDLALRAVGKAGLVAQGRLRGAYRSIVPETTRALRVRVPGYHLIEVAGRKRRAAYPPAP
jgi:2-polyprenyl-3-methyl-5-hydroxy-6-metoxy-1,4-benzoquinol methylase